MVALALACGLAAGLIGGTWLLTLAWLSARARVEAPGPASTDELLALLAASVAVAIAGWLCLGAALEVLARVPGPVGRAAGRWAERLTPALARRAAAFVLGVGVGVAGGPSQAVAGSGRPPPAVSGPGGSSEVVRMPAAPGFVPAPLTRIAVADPGFVPAPLSRIAVADPGFVPAPLSRIAVADPGFASLADGPRVGTEPPSPGFTPTAPRVRPQADPGLLGARTRAGSDGEVVVHRGDTLWSIAARHLGADANDPEIAAAWPQWFEANRDRIGDDPDHLLPGRVLRVPERHRPHPGRSTTTTS